MPEVLIVDDSEGTRLLLSMAFADVGYEVREAADGIEALSELVQRAPDALVLDLVMPRLGGFAVLTAMREQGLAPAARVLVHSSEDTAAHRACADALGADDFILKPTDPFSVVDRVEAVLALAGAPRPALGAIPTGTRRPAEVIGVSHPGASSGEERLADVIELRPYTGGTAGAAGAAG